MPNISVILPAYNAAATLGRSMDSLLSQDFESFEVLLVDDGSTDATSGICDDYALRDNRVRVFHTDNCGVSSARQKGLVHARGEYVIHFDSDDYADPGMLSSLYREALVSNADIVVCDFYTQKDEECALCRQMPTALTPDAFLRDLYSRLHGACWNKLVKLSCIRKHDVSFPEGIDYCEDLCFWSRLLSHDDVTVAYLPQAFYHYVENSSSITRSVTRRNYEGLVAFHECIKALLPDDDFFHRVKEEYTFAHFEAGFANDLLSQSEIKKYKKLLNPIIFKYKRGRMLLAYILLMSGFQRLSKKLMI